MNDEHLGAVEASTIMGSLSKIRSPTFHGLVVERR